MADAPNTLPQTGLAIPMSPDEAGAWQSRIDASTKAADAKREDWKPYVTAYMVKSTAVNGAGDHTVTVPLIYAYTELKKSQLRFQVPEAHQKPKRPEFAGAVRAYEAAVNHEIKESGADAMLDMTTTDVLICGIAAVKVGYYADIRTRQVPVMQPVMQPVVDPVTGQPVVDPMTGAPAAQPVMDPATGQPAQKQATTPVQDDAGQLVFDPATGNPVQEPAFTTEEYVAHECYYGDRLAPENLLFPPEFSGKDYDRAAYIGHRFQLDLQTAKRVYKLPETFTPTASRPQQTLSSDEQSEGRDALVTKDVEGVELFYLATVFAQPPLVENPETGKSEPDPTWEPPRVGQYRRLVFIKNQSQPVVHEDSPYQYIDEADGKLKGMVGNPIHVLTLRYLPGSCYPVSDVQAGWPSAEEMNLGRSQMVNFRERVMPVTGIDRNRATAEMKKQLEANADVKIGKVVGVDGPPGEIIQPISVAQWPRENFKFDEIVRGDYELSWSMGKNQTGQMNEGEPVTAEEVRASQGATDTRLAYEQTQLLKWWCGYVDKFGSLLQQFKDEPGYAEIVGDDGVKQLRAWSRKGTSDGSVLTIAGEFVSSSRPDAALRLDINQERQQIGQMYNMVGNDPNVNRVEILKKWAIAWGLEPEKLIVEQLPEKGPEPPRISWSFKGEDLSPVDAKTGQPNGQFPLVLAIAQQGGIQFPAEAIQNAMLLGKQIMAQAQAALLAQPAQPGQPETEHGGAMTPMSPVTKQVGDRTTNGAHAIN